jgi:hypothetical protein
VTAGASGPGGRARPSPCSSRRRGAPPAPASPPSGARRRGDRPRDGTMRAARHAGRAAPGGSARTASAPCPPRTRRGRRPRHPSSIAGGALQHRARGRGLGVDAVDPRRRGSPSRGFPRRRSRESPARSRTSARPRPLTTATSTPGRAISRSSARRVGSGIAASSGRSTMGASVPSKSSSSTSRPVRLQASAQPGTRSSAWGSILVRLHPSRSAVRGLPPPAAAGTFRAEATESAGTPHPPDFRTFALLALPRPHSSPMSWIDQVKLDDRGLVPVVAQDARTGEVLMLAWANAEALRRTLDTGRATYWSRSRGELWTKGETSGNAQAGGGGARGLRRRRRALPRAPDRPRLPHRRARLLLPRGRRRRAGAGRTIRATS